MDYLEEYKKLKTISSWTLEEAKKHESLFIRLMAKDVEGKANLKEKISIKINSLLLYNNIDYISDEEILQTAKEILKLK